MGTRVPPPLNLYHANVPAILRVGDEQSRIPPRLPSRTTRRTRTAHPPLRRLRATIHAATQRRPLLLKRLPSRNLAANHPPRRPAPARRHPVRAERIRLSRPAHLHARRRLPQALPASSNLATRLAPKPRTAPHLPRLLLRRAHQSPRRRRARRATPRRRRTRRPRGPSPPRDPRNEWLRSGSRAFLASRGERRGAYARARYSTRPRQGSSSSSRRSPREVRRERPAATWDATGDHRARSGRLRHSGGRRSPAGSCRASASRRCARRARRGSTADGPA
jgi:hypothetical protein